MLVRTSLHTLHHRFYHGRCVDLPVELSASDLLGEEWEGGEGTRYQ